MATHHDNPGVSIVTGAASGMGKACASLLRRSGALLLCDLDAARLEDVAKPLRADGPVEILAGDIADADYVDRLIASLAGRRVAALIHCAGLSPTMGSAERILEVNLAATLRLVAAVRPHMAEGAAAILFGSTAAHMMGAKFDARLAEVTEPSDVAALSALVSDPGAAYAVSKRGVLLLARREAMAFGRAKARVLSVSPGVVDTPMGRRELELQPSMARLVEMSPLGRSGRPEEIAAVATFLCSAQAGFVTGTDVLVDGGSIASLPSAM